jgi:hypothetical protein
MTAGTGAEAQPASRMVPQVALANWVWAAQADAAQGL